MLDAYDVVLNDEYKTGARNAIIGGIFWGLSQFMQFGAQALALWYGSKLLENGEIENVSDMLRVCSLVPHLSKFVYFLMVRPFLR